MYPRVSDFINDVFGTHLNLPIQSYGFFLALAFVCGGYLLNKELIRQEKAGHVWSTKRKTLTGQKAGFVEMVSIFVISLLVGFKLTGLVIHYQEFVNNPQAFVFSSTGNWIGGLILASAMTFIQYYLKKQKALDPPLVKEVEVRANEQTWSIVFIAVIFGIIGAKIFHQFENWNDFVADPLGSLFSFSGLTFYGGLIVATFGVGYYGENHGIPWKRMADSIAPSLILAYGIGRIGCQVAGDGDWGIVNLDPMPQWLSFLPDWVWAYRYPHNILNEGIRIEGCTGAHCFQLAQPVFPTPLYETTMSLLIFLILWSIRKRFKTAGMLFAIYLMLNGIERFLIEQIRVNNVLDFLGIKATQAEVIATLIFGLGLGFLIYLLAQKPKPTI
ncbi:MAG: diacylglyceryl transferase [Bacteroidetes bacterium CG18_big_fil_WC_8_21_14_2_50_41_14]|nr:MAG: diacylglyceryl transferase [Bacteroidetes bacterium CG18_big_fil_WC_8_21_14_2_50_41_14]PIY33737.1 MAG: diacylglyceryl transferase [Bacteroidetes bacterium CG_4_10_14_3_um_filter_42_6]PJB59353.1 MAG: diacylglyceryl transferase [Bacteroidetes bacterium CG_4_9_14_3_um_filter_41_19]